MRVRQRTRSIRSTWAPSLIRRLVRHRAMHAALIVGAGALAAFSLAARVDALDQERAAWGETKSVAVVVEAVAVGEPIHGAIAMQVLPLELVPPTAATSVAEASLAKVPLYPGEVLLTARITNAGNSVLPPDTAALTLQVVADVPLVAAGDLVDVWSVNSADFTSRRVAEQVVVLALTDRTITVAVPNSQVSDATAASLRPVIVTLVG